jgi:hypothetical protein
MGIMEMNRGSFLSTSAIPLISNYLPISFSYTGRRMEGQNFLYMLSRIYEVDLTASYPRGDVR